MILASVWLVLAYELDFKTVVVLAIMVAIVKGTAAYVKWVAIDTCQLVHKGHIYYVFPKEHWEGLEASSHFELAVNYLTEGDKDSAIREYQIIKDLDKELANELYDRIFSKCP